MTTIATSLLPTNLAAITVLVTPPGVVHVFRTGHTANVTATVLQSAPVGYAAAGALRENPVSVVRRPSAIVLNIIESVIRSFV